MTPPKRGKPVNQARKPSYFNPPPETLPVFKYMPKEQAQEVFAARLQALMLRKGWNQSDLAREAGKHMADKTFGRDLVSNYIRAKFLPTAPHLNALARALGCEPDEIMPTRGVARVGDQSPTSTRDLGDGNCWLHIDRAVPWPVAMQVLTILSGGEMSNVTPKNAQRS